jgi:type III restriction enzyme
VTIRSRLDEFDPRQGEASLYRTRDLAPERLMPDLAQGRVVITNWHVFEPEGMQIGGVSAKVAKIGVPRRLRDAADLLQVKQEHRDNQGNLKKVEIEAIRYVETETAVVECAKSAASATSSC